LSQVTPPPSLLLPCIQDFRCSSQLQRSRLRGCTRCSPRTTKIEIPVNWVLAQRQLVPASIYFSCRRQAGRQAGRQPEAASDRQQAARKHEKAGRKQLEEGSRKKATGSSEQQAAGRRQQESAKSRR